MYFNLNMNKMFFFFILIFSTLISISSNSWLGCWVGLEINLLSFIPLISNVNNMMSSEASLKYFLTQSIASINLLFFIILMSIFFFNMKFNNFLYMLINMSLMMKMGSAPFHFWFPMLIENLSWMNCFIIMTWQKIAPIILLSYLMNNNFLMYVMMMNTIIGAIGGISQTSLRKILAFSSINNLGWMMSAIMISENLFLFYFFIYSFLIFSMCSIFYFMNTFFFNQIFFYNLKPLIKISLFMNLLSLGGLPPFLGFMPKWILINFLIFNKMMMLTFIFIMGSLILLYFYIRLTYSSFLLNYLKSKWFKMKNKNMSMKYFNFTIFFSLLSLPMSTLFFL
uniref:NADH-ubiquinone oxidoreductase chain 2 n=1 Tax=Prays oleae TaxID=627135 RepID=A0A0U1XQX5_9NEOP|nr:NADH dehydrogenase subunit 2 [Prays oleae]AIY61490.1 NADH dehydrogenase subunit 2 [Prays oleae]